MSGSSIGKLFVVTNFGESHGPAIGCVIDGCPPGMPLSEADIQPDLDRRRPGQSKFVTQRKEADAVKILSGVYEGVTTGTPIALLIENTDQRSRDYSEVARQFRPSHADWSYWNKYGIRDPRGGGRSSARLTAPTVAAGAVARKWLSTELGITIRARVSSIGTVKLPLENWDEVDNNPFFAANVSNIAEVETYLGKIRKEGNSIGATVEFEVVGVPAGLGSPLYDRLDAPSILTPLKSLDIEGNEIEVVTKGRHDPCVGIRAVPVVEAVIALVLMDAALMQRAQCGSLGVRPEDLFR